MLWSIGPSDLLVGVLFGLVAHLGMQAMRPPEAVACARGAHRWSASESVAGVPSPRGLPCGPGPRVSAGLHVDVQELLVGKVGDLETDNTGLCKVIVAEP